MGIEQKCVYHVGNMSDCVNELCMIYNIMTATREKVSHPLGWWFLIISLSSTLSNFFNIAIFDLACSSPR